MNVKNKLSFVFPIILYNRNKKRKLGIFIFFNFRITYAKTGNDSMLIESFPVFMLNQIFNSSEYYMRLLHMFV